MFDVRCLLSPFSSLIHSSLGKKYIVAATGAFLGLFLVIHAAGNSATFFGGDAFNAYSAHLHSLGAFLLVPEALLATAFLLHAATAAVLFVENRMARPSRYAVTPAVTPKINSATMPYTGLMIFLFVLVHLYNFHFITGRVPVAQMVRETLSRPALALFYLAGLTALALHLSHGLWSLLQSFGINHPKYDGAFHRTSLGVALVIGGLFMTIVILALSSATFLR